MNKVTINDYTIRKECWTIGNDETGEEYHNTMYFVAHLDGQERGYKTLHNLRDAFKFTDEDLLYIQLKIG